MKLTCALVVTLLLLSSSCSAPSGTDGGTDGGNAAISAACSVDATAACETFERCERGGAATLYGSLSACVDALKTQCEAAFAAPGSQRSVDQLALCSAARTSESCTDVFNNIPPGACAPPAGTRAMGAPCVFNAQCASSWCSLGHSTCGTCAPLPVPGTDCSNQACGQGLQCISRVEDGGVTLRCQAIVTAVGGQCDHYVPCGEGLSCVGSQLFLDAGVRTEGTCQTSGADAGIACDPRQRTAPGCVAQDGLFCSTASLTCEVDTPMAAGGGCGSIDAGTSRGICTLGASCLNATCVAPAALGAACDLDLGPLCQRPLHCVTDGGSTGSCFALDPTMCN